MYMPLFWQVIYDILLISGEIAEVKSELEEEGLSSDEAVKLIQQVYRRVSTFNSNMIESQGPVLTKVTKHFQLWTFYFQKSHNSYIMNLINLFLFTTLKQ